MTTNFAESDSPSRYVVGIDLGTTNSAVAFVDTAAEPWRVETFAVPQLVAPGVVEARETLPSFHYQAARRGISRRAHCGCRGAAEIRIMPSAFSPAIRGGVAGPTDRFGQVVALSSGRRSHGRAVALAGAAGRRSALARRSRAAATWPTFASAWNDRFPDDPLESQEVVLTLPASFDEVARELTVKPRPQPVCRESC